MIIRERCVACRQCSAHCTSGALAIEGYWISAARVVAKAVRLKPFFDHAEGGMTLAGGEVTRQVGFADAVVAGCQSQGIHTVIETCGACSWPHLQRLVEYTDLVRNDVTLLDEERHHQCAGGANQHILPNARRLAPCNAQIHVPLIPGITDTEENHGPIFSLMRELGLTLVALLPHNPSTTAKYKWLCLPSEIVEESRSGERLAEVAIMAQETGLEGTIG